jgi:hypothetical protein
MFKNYKLMCVKDKYVVSPRYVDEFSTLFKKCPHCRKRLIDISDSTKIPQKRNKKAWERIAEIYAKRNGN